MAYHLEPLKRKSRTTMKWFSAIVIMLFSVVPVLAQTSEKSVPMDSILSNPLFDILLLIVILLLIMIAVMADVVKNVARGVSGKPENLGKTFGAIVVLIAMYPYSARAADLVSGASKNTFYEGLDPTLFWLMILVIAFEIIVLTILLIIVQNLLGVEEKKNQMPAADHIQGEEPSLLERINASVSVEKEEEIMLDHNYDGIRELDNDLPPWWKYGFYITILWACIYLVHFHVTKTGSLQLEEYNTELKQADAALADYRKKSLSMVDETHVVQLKDEASLTLGKQLFLDNCSACHGKSGQGIVGPNLTDDYWLHGGSMNDIFKTIKYGYQEKGMKSWKDDFSASRIQAIASFIKGIHGTNPPNAKEKQGILYADQTSSSDSTHATPLKTDSLVGEGMKQK